MKPAHKKLFTLSLLLATWLISACGPQAATPTTPSVPAPASPTAAAANTVAPTTAAGLATSTANTVTADARSQVVYSFLNLVFGPGAGGADNEAAVRKLLTPDLATTLGDKPAMSLLGIQVAPQRYAVTPGSQPSDPATTDAYFNAYMNYEGGTEVRRFTLAPNSDGNSWLIQSIQRVPDLATETASP